MARSLFAVSKNSLSFHRAGPVLGGGAVHFCQSALDFLARKFGSNQPTGRTRLLVGRLAGRHVPERVGWAAAHDAHEA